MELQGKNMLVIGAGLSGFAAAKVGKSMGAKVTLSDAKEEKDIHQDFSELREKGIELKFGPQEEKLLEGVDLVLVSPAVPLRIPILQEAIRREIPVISEVEMAYRLSGSPICAVTGTNGKTTTVTLLGLLLKTRFENVGVGGNIGIPLCEEVLRVGEGGCIAAEISSYQMEATNSFRPHVSVVLNVTPDHLLRHGSMEVYQQMKERMFAEETMEDYLVLNYDDERTRSMKERALCQVCFFSRKKALEEGAFLRDDMLMIRWKGASHELCRISELGIRGSHNVENALAASMAAYLMGAEPGKMSEVLRAFRGVEHRIEHVRDLEGVSYYNDSKATNTDSAIKALETFPDHIILLAGGDDKLTDLTDFMGLVKERVDELILLGNAAKRFHEAATARGIPEEHIHEAGYSMEKAVEIARSLAKKPQVVLLSPACASFDMYGNFEERGRDFKRIVNRL